MAGYLLFFIVLAGGAAAMINGLMQIYLSWRDERYFAEREIEVSLADQIAELEAEVSRPIEDIIAEAERRAEEH